MKPRVLSSILDFPRKTLNPQLWVHASTEELPTLNPQLRKAILDRAHKELRALNAKLLGCMLYGGSASYQWTDGADIDVSLYIDWELHPDLDPEIVEKHFKTIEIPFKGHPVHLFVKPPSQKEQLEVADAYYDVLHDHWVLPPLILPQGFDPDIYFAPFLKAAERKAQQFDIKIGDLRRHWAIWSKTDEAEGEGPRDPQLVQQRIKAEAVIIKSIIQEIVDEFTAIRKKRYALHDEIRDRMTSGEDVGRFARFQEPEIIWKYLDRAGYVSFIQKLKEALESGHLDAVLSLG